LPFVAGTGMNGPALIVAISAYSFPVIFLWTNGELEPV
jgi:hypothetical protein